MGTTSLIVELVIIGFQVLVWMSLIVLILFGYKGIDLSKLKDWTTVISLALVGVSYTLGIVFDSFVGSLFAQWQFSSWRWLLSPEDRKAGNHPARMRAYITAFNSDASEELTRRINRNSLIRATSLNLVLISITSLIWVQKQYGFWLKLDLMIVVFSVLLIGLTLITWRSLLQTYYRYLSDIYNAMRESEKKNTPSTKG